AVALALPSAGGWLPVSAGASFSRPHLAQATRSRLSQPAGPDCRAPLFARSVASALEPRHSAPLEAPIPAATRRIERQADTANRAGKAAGPPPAAVDCRRGIARVNGAPEDKQSPARHPSRTPGIG